MSTLFRLDWRDLVKGLFVTIMSAFLTTLAALIQNQGFTLSHDNAAFIMASGVTAGISYLVKQLATDEQGKLGGKI